MADLPSSTQGARESTLPLWVDSLHRFALHGTPDPSIAQESLDTWNSHAAELFGDPSARPILRALKIVGSALAHALWRLTQGPATTVSTGFLVGLVGFASAAFFAKDLGALVESKNGLIFLGLLLFGYVLARNPGAPSPRLTVFAFILLVPSALWTAWQYWTEPEIPTERIAGFGAILCIFGAFEFSRSAVDQDHVTRARAWRIFALGIGTFALANLIGATQYDSAEVRTTAAIASWIEALLAASLLRNARSELKRAESAVAVPDRPVPDVEIYS